MQNKLIRIFVITLGFFVGICQASEQLVQEGDRSDRKYIDRVRYDTGIDLASLDNCVDQEPLQVNKPSLKDFVSEELKSFVKEDKAQQKLVGESNYYSIISFNVGAIREKYPKELSADDYLNYLDELNSFLIKAKKDHRHIEDVLLDEVNLLRQQWLDGLQRSALVNSIKNGEVVQNAE